MGIKLNSSGGGSVTVQEPNTAANLTHSLPARSGNVALDGPAFSAYQTAQQTGISAATLTKVTFDAEEFDTNNNFASSRFTPTVAGYYQISGGVQTGGSPTVMIVEAWKNGSPSKRFGNSNTGTVSHVSGSGLIYCNGSTDYVELYVYLGSGGSTDSTNQSRTWFTGTLARAA